ncbi:tail fiber protein, partial [Salmonella enterica]|nr:tail fiber protein [Salmonella enterica]
LTDTVNLAAGAMQKDQNGADIPDKPLFVRTLGIADSYPAGCPIPYPGPTAPNSYLLMDGRAFSKTLYPQLAKLYADGYLPDLRGMYVRGWDNIGRVDVAADNSTNTNQLAGAIYHNLSGRSLYSPASLDRTGPRGYGLYLKKLGSAGAFLEKGRVLLSEQYYEYLMDDFTGTMNQIFNENDVLHKHGEPYYKVEDPPEYISPDKGWQAIKQAKITLMQEERIISPDAPDRWQDPHVREITGTTPKSFKKDRLAPVGVPNVAFNYITKAA